MSIWFLLGLEIKIEIGIENKEAVGARVHPCALRSSHRLEYYYMIFKALLKELTFKGIIFRVNEPKSIQKYKSVKGYFVIVHMTVSRFNFKGIKDNHNSTDEWIKAWQKSEEFGKQHNNSLLDLTYRRSTQEHPDNDLEKRDISNYEGNKKSSSPLLSSPKLISNINKKLIRKPIECAKYAVWHKTEKYYVPLPCKKWSCPVCGKKNDKILEKRLANSEASKWEIKRHIILTVAEDSIPSNLSEILNDFITDLRRNGFFRLKYIWVKEFQYERFLKCGVWWRHIHMVVNMNISKYDIIPYWNKHNKNKFNMIEVRKIRNFKKGSYLTKYFTKEEYQDMFDKNEKRYGSSKNVLPPILKKLPSGDWEFMLIDEARNLYDSYFRTPEMDITWLKKEGYG